MRETAAVKARRLLAEGRVTVLVARPQTAISAVVRGEGAWHRCGWDGGTWWCRCTSATSTKVANCSHVQALKLITAPEEAVSNARP